ncbi:DUF2336 domain-containing protein [Phenylobacterium sp.]|jgi:uncharacterized protein (DUF2336 family)|uniref:DUF2336 domain-containing protein n=1 Tax=Phenylobacterium sp. TaxID=1871053 RepID=UPI002E31527C|nr:DUF2336 domain-containing protein [Phenylobacterium sp.]HEX2559749.1 DUF2336 domain-containing protein [Phenylobacterium sp.]
MSVTRGALTEGDIRSLVKGATPDERAAAAEKLCRAIGGSELSDSDRAMAQDILRLMARDMTEMVRRALVVTLKESPVVPRDVAMHLASDVAAIALPILSFSPAFTDDDLAEVVRLGGPVRQLAIARRPRLSSKVTDVIAEAGDEPAVHAACVNPGADFSEPGLTRVLERFERSERVLAAVALRNALPLSVAEKLIGLLAGELREQLAARYGLGEAAGDVAELTRERATVDLVDEAGRAADLKAFVAHLGKEGRLSASLLLRAAAQGQMGLFEWGVAELACVPHHRTWLMIHDAGPLGLRAIYDRAGLPARLYGAFRAAVDTFHALEAEGGPMERERFQTQMLQRFLSRPHTINREDLDYLLERMDRLSRREELPAAAPEARLAG